MAIVNSPQCQAIDCEAQATLPSGFCSKRCYHRQYRRDHCEELNAQQRQRYAEDGIYRQTLTVRNLKYAATEAGQISLIKRHARHEANDPTYHIRYAKEHSAEAVERARQWRLSHARRISSSHANACG